MLETTTGDSQFFHVAFVFLSTSDPALARKCWPALVLEPFNLDESVLMRRTKMGAGGGERCTS